MEGSALYDKAHCFRMGSYPGAIRLADVSRENGGVERLFLSQGVEMRTTLIGALALGAQTALRRIDAPVMEAKLTRTKPLIR